MWNGNFYRSLCFLREVGEQVYWHKYGNVVCCEGTVKQLTAQVTMMEGTMSTEVRVKTVILPGGKIEISTPELIPGRRATVVVTIEDNEAVEQPHVIDILKTLAGHRLYQSVEEVDAYIREERDAWEC
jgi:hypothetical protein